MSAHLGALLLGLGFGFILSRAGLSDYNTIKDMLLLRDLRMYMLMATAVATALPLVWWLKRARPMSLAGVPVEIERAPLQRKTIIGAACFGVGWAMTGACPGPILTQLGEGKVLALVTFAASLAGAYAGVLIEARRPALAELLVARPRREAPGAGEN